MLNKIKSDKALTDSVSFIVIISFIMTLLIAFIDVGLYFNTKNQMMSAAENGARSVALYGGVNTAVRAKRGNPNFSPIEAAWASVPANFKKPDVKIVIVKKGNITCYPVNEKIKAGDLVWCEIKYRYNGLAGKFGIFNLGETLKGKGNGSLMTVRGSSVSEVTIE